MATPAEDCPLWVDQFNFFSVHLLDVVRALIDAADRDKEGVTNHVIGLTDKYCVRTCWNAGPLGIISNIHVLSLWNVNVRVRIKRSSVDVEDKMGFITLQIRVGVVCHCKIEVRERLVWQWEVADELYFG